MNYMAAKEMCQMEGGALFEPKDEELNTIAITKALSMGMMNVILGMEDPDGNGM